MNRQVKAASPFYETLLGTTLGGRYRIEAPLAEGGMAMVYRATQEGARRQVAVKVLHPHLAVDREFAQRFRREARVASMLSHPSIVRVLDFGSEGIVFYIVMELLEGEDLLDLLQRECPLEPTRAMRIMVTVLKALAAAHGQGIVHRDLKPENVFISRGPDGVEAVKVLDFGIAKMLGREEEDEDGEASLVTNMGAILGTPEYMSPEQCSGLPSGPGADIYGCGALLYTLLTGRPPFTAEHPIKVTFKHLTEVPLPPSALRPGLDPDLERAVLTALAKDPGDRHASAAVFAGVLEGLLASCAPTADPDRLAVHTEEDDAPPLQSVRETPTLAALQITRVEEAPAPRRDEVSAPRPISDPPGPSKRTLAGDLPQKAPRCPP